MTDLVLTDLDELVLTVRDRNTRTYINEAITAYRARAYRPAIMSTWVAVAFDIIAKIRELALQGGRAAASFVTNLDDAIAAKDRGDPQGIVRLQQIENDLIQKATKDFEFLSANEATDLQRLKEDRNLCAHPAFTPYATLVQPLPEQVRAHIVHAIIHLLQHPPVQGIHALNRLKADLLQPSFPTDQSTVSAFLEARYLDHAKRALLENLVTVLLKILIKRSEPDLIGKEASVQRCLAAMQIRHAAVYESKMRDELPRICEGLLDGELLRVFGIFSSDIRAWNWLPLPTQVRLKGIARAYVYDTGASDFVFDALNIPDLRADILAAFARLAEHEKTAIIARKPRNEWIDEAISIYEGVGSFRSAEAAGALLLPLAPGMNTDQVKRVIQAIGNNGQIYSAAGSPAIVADLFDRTSHTHLETIANWQELLTQLIGENGGDVNARYSCPDLRLKMAARGMWPVPVPVAIAPPAAV